MQNIRKIGAKNEAFSKPLRYRAQASKESKSEIISIKLTPKRKTHYCNMQSKMIGLFHP
jgi:hypothetical protein